jgi:TusA-related sulfurtransferase
MAIADPAGSTGPAFPTLATTDLQGLGFDAGAHLMVKHALACLPVGGELRVTGSAPGWQAQLSGWCRDQGHGLRWEDGEGAAPAMAIVVRGGAQAGRWRGAAQTGRSDARAGDDAVAAQAQPFWGLRAVRRWRPGRRPSISASATSCRSGPTAPPTSTPRP